MSSVTSEGLIVSCPFDHNDEHARYGPTKCLGPNPVDCKDMTRELSSVLRCFAQQIASIQDEQWGEPD